MQHMVSEKDFQNDVERYLDLLITDEDRLVLTKDGVPTAVVVTYSAYESYQGQLEALKQEISASS